MNQRERQYQKTLDSLRKAVDDLIVEQGVEKLTIRGICDRAGINHGTFYHYFKSKDDMLMDRQRRFVTYFSDLYESDLKNLDCHQALKRYTDEYFAYIESRLSPILNLFEQSLLNHSLKEKLEETDAQIILRRLIRKGIDSGELCCSESEEPLYNHFQVLFLGIRLQFCHSKGTSLPSPYTQRTIQEWIDSLFNK